MEAGKVVRLVLRNLAHPENLSDPSLTMNKTSILCVLPKRYHLLKLKKAPKSQAKSSLKGKTWSLLDEEKASIVTLKIKMGLETQHLLRRAKLKTIETAVSQLKSQESAVWVSTLLLLTEKP